MEDGYPENEDGIEFEETMEDEDEDNDDWMYESVESGRKALLILRSGVENLFEDWDTVPFRDKEIICYSYFHFLFMVGLCIHKDKRDVTTDFNILEDVKTRLERDLVEGERHYFETEFVVICARKKLGMMLQKLDSIIPDNDFRKWIQEKLGDTDLQRYFEYVDFRLGYLPEEFADQLKLKVTLNVEINFENPDDIRNQLTGYLEEEQSAFKRPRGKEDCVSCAPFMFRSIEDAMCKLRGIYSEMDIKEEKPDGVHPTIQAVDGVQPAIQADDGVKLAKPGGRDGKKEK